MPHSTLNTANRGVFFVTILNSRKQANNVRPYFITCLPRTGKVDFTRLRGQKTKEDKKLSLLEKGRQTRRKYLQGIAAERTDKTDVKRNIFRILLHKTPSEYIEYAFGRIYLHNTKSLPFVADFLYPFGSSAGRIGRCHIPL